MKNSLGHTAVMYNRYTRFLGALLTVILFATSFAMSVEKLNLRSTESFVILGQSAITGTTNSAISGNVGLSPAAGSYITGFQGSNVKGTIYVIFGSGGHSGSVEDDSRLTTAINDFSTAYTDATARSADFTNTGASVNIGGMSLGPGVYKFIYAASISGSDLTLSGNSTDVWIFQKGSTLTVGADIHIILSGGAQASNIF